jgi:hypothetical protein
VDAAAHTDAAAAAGTPPAWEPVTPVALQPAAPTASAGGGAAVGGDAGVLELGNVMQLNMGEMAGNVGDMMAQMMEMMQGGPAGGMTAVQPAGPAVRPVHLLVAQLLGWDWCKVRAGRRSR